MQQSHTDDADEYAEDEFEVQEDHEPKQSKIPVSKKQQIIQKQRSKESTDADYLNQNNSGLKIKQKNSGPKLLSHAASKENLQNDNYQYDYEQAQQLRENPSNANIIQQHHQAMKRKPPVHK